MNPPGDGKRDAGSSKQRAEGCGLDAYSFTEETKLSITHYFCTVWYISL